MYNWHGTCIIRHIWKTYMGAIKRVSTADNYGLRSSARMRPRSNYKSSGYGSRTYGPKYATVLVRHGVRWIGGLLANPYFTRAQCFASGDGGWEARGPRVGWLTVSVWTARRRNHHGAAAPAWSGGLGVSTAGITACVLTYLSPLNPGPRPLARQCRLHDRHAMGGCMAS